MEYNIMEYNIMKFGIYHDDFTGLISKLFKTIFS